MSIRVFLAHPKSVDDETIERLKLMATALCEEEVRKVGGKSAIEVVTGRDDFAQRAVEAGGWEPWCESVGNGRAWRDGTLQPLFDIIVVTPRATFGRATATLVHHALAAKKPVFVMVDEDNPKLRQATNVFVTDRNDYQNGYLAE